MQHHQHGKIFQSLGEAFEAIHLGDDIIIHLTVATHYRKLNINNLKI